MAVIIAVVAGAVVVAVVGVVSTVMVLFGPWVDVFLSMDVAPAAMSVIAAFSAERL